ncbi:MAG: CoA transferase [Desulfomonilaceae bacterium]|jgi:formyl-CoA transferase
MKTLYDLKVLSLEQAMVVPYLTYRLAMDGMQVIRLENPAQGDPNRMVGDNVLNEERMNSYFLCINAGKKAITLNLAQPAGRELLQKLIKELDVDIFVTNQLPRNYKKLGIDYEILKAVKEDIIWMGITGFGPNSDEGAYDPVLQARSGLMDLTGEPDREPQVLGIPLADLGTSEHAYGLLMRAIFNRSVTGQGCRIDLSMFDSSVSWLTVPITMTASFGKHISRCGNTHEFFAPVSVYQTKNGFIYLAVGNDRQWKAMVAEGLFSSLDKPEYGNNAGRIKDVTSLNVALNSITSEHTSEELITFFTAITVPVSKINSISELISEPSVQRRLLSTLDPKTKMSVTLTPPPHMTSFLESNNLQMTFPPRLGEHNEEFYGKLGFSDQNLTKLREDGVI